MPATERRTIADLHIVDIYRQYHVQYAVLQAANLLAALLPALLPSLEVELTGPFKLDPAFSTPTTHSPRSEEDECAPARQGSGNGAARRLGPSL